MTEDLILGATHLRECKFYPKFQTFRCVLTPILSTKHTRTQTQKYVGDL